MAVRIKLVLVQNKHKKSSVEDYKSLTAGEEIKMAEISTVSTHTMNRQIDGVVDGREEGG